MADVCDDNRFEIIAEAKKDLIESTNIEMSQDEMAVLDNFLFRCWQMGWLRRYDKAKDINVPYKERTAKVPYCPERYYCDDALKLMVMDIFGDYIYATDDIDLEKLREALNTLLERDQRIMFMRYQNCETLENIGKEFGVTRERIRQIIARALRILRHPKFEIAKAKPAEPERKWIPVSEALPEEDGKLTGYLVSIGYDVTIMCFVDGKFLSWTFADNKLVEKQFPVSAWMPLPEPYRGEE